jgi:hypothetical protein
MEKTITLYDLQHYLHEINQIEKRAPGKKQRDNSPSNFTLQNLLRYSSALNILKTRTAGTIYQLAN